MNILLSNVEIINYFLGDSFSVVEDICVLILAVPSTSTFILSMLRNLSMFKFSHLMNSQVDTHSETATRKEKRIW